MEPGEEEGVDAVVGSHKQNQQGKGETFAEDDDGKGEGEVDRLEREGGVVFAAYADGENNEGSEGGGDVGNALGIGEPFDGHAMAGSPEEEGADNNHHHAVEDADDAVPFEEHKPFEVAAKIEDERVEELVEREDCQQMELAGAVAGEKADGEGDDEVEAEEGEFDTQHAGQVLVDELGMAGDVAGVEVGDPQVEEDVENVGEIEDSEVKAVLVGTYSILDTCLNAQNPERLDEQVEQENPKEA